LKEVIEFLEIEGKENLREKLSKELYKNSIKVKYA